MLIDTKIDNHILQIDKELENYDILEFKTTIVSIFNNQIIPTKEDIKILSLVFRICIDYIKDNKNNLFKLETYNLIDYINNIVYKAKLLNFKITYSSKHNMLGFNIIVSLDNDNNTYCLNEKLCIDDIKYYTIEEIISKLIVFSIDIDE